jgi:glycosyltransferase involved in cell wall biosynthesis
MRDIAAAIITIDRSPKEGYLGKTLDNLVRSGIEKSQRLHSLTVVDGGGPESFHATARVFDSKVDRLDFVSSMVGHHDEKVFANLNVARALEEAASHGTKWVLLMEDDIDVCDDFIDAVGRWLDDHVHPKYRVYALGANYGDVDDLAERGETCWPYPLMVFYGTQAWAVRNKDALSIAAFLRQHCEDEVEQVLASGEKRVVSGTGWDLLIARKWMPETYPDLNFFLTPCPSFIQHIGFGSSLQPDESVHVFPSFPGREWTYQSRSTVRLPRETTKKILWVGDAVVSSGFARCTHAVCDHLHEEGWDVHVLGINYFGDPHDYPYSIYPCYQPQAGGRDAFGVFRLADMVRQIGPDVVVFLNDPWNIPNYMASLRYLQEEQHVTAPPAIGWLAVDAKNQPGDAINDLSHVITWTDFALQELKAGGYRGSGSVVPLGVDLDVFKPMETSVARSQIQIDGQLMPQDDFIIGVVGRNQFRKRLDLTLEYFAAFIHKYGIDDAKLFIQIAPTEEDAFHLSRLMKYYNIEDKVIISEGEMAFGFKEQVLSVIYNSFDVLFTTTQGEGWGLTSLEAMACGVPVIAPDWSGLGDWAAGAARLIPCTSTATSAPFGNMSYTIGGIPDKDLTVQALRQFYLERDFRNHYARAGFERAQELSWNNVGPNFEAVLDEVLAPRARVALPTQEVAVG